MLRATYMEIYNENINDLLSKETNLQIHESKERGVYISGLKEEIVSDVRAVARVIRRGEANRHTSATDYNEQSSRSHTIFQVIIESSDCADPQGSGVVHTSSRTFKASKTRLSVLVSLISPPLPPLLLLTLLFCYLQNLIDLAGSEKVTTNADRKREGGFINRSLLTLGSVIAKISEGKG